jgi:hypothetical protein
MAMLQHLSKEIFYNVQNILLSDILCNSGVKFSLGSVMTDTVFISRYSFFFISVNFCSKFSRHQRDTCSHMVNLATIDLY